jgi:hypothetical protein
MRRRACGFPVFGFPVSPENFVVGGMISADESSLGYLSYSEATDREQGISEVSSTDASASKATGGGNFPKRNGITVLGKLQGRIINFRYSNIFVV